MEYVCGPLILYSQDKIRMLDFFSDVLELDVNSEEDLVRSDTFELKLIEAPESDKSFFHSPGIVFLFKLKSVDQIEEILSKFNFFLYRKADKESCFEITNNDLTKQSLSIKDIDGRLWQFDVESVQ